MLSCFLTWNILGILWLGLLLWKTSLDGICSLLLVTMAFRLLVQLQLASLWLTKSPALPDWSARQFEQKHSQLLSGGWACGFAFLLSRYRKLMGCRWCKDLPPKVLVRLLLYECQLHSTYLAKMRPPTSADCMSRVYGVEKKYFPWKTETVKINTKIK